MIVRHKSFGEISPLVWAATSKRNDLPVLEARDTIVGVDRANVADGKLIRKYSGHAGILLVSRRLGTVFEQAPGGAADA